MIPVRTCLPLFCWTKKLMKTEESSSILPFFWDLLLGPICSMWAWASQTLTLFRFAVTTQIIEGDAPYEWVILFVHLTQGRTCTHSRPSCLCATSSLRKWTIGTIPESLKHKPGETVQQGELQVEFDDPDYFRWKGHWVRVIQTSKTLRGSSVYWNQRSLHLTILSNQPELLSHFVEDARQHCGIPIKLEPRFVAQPVARLMGGSRPNENQEELIQNVMRDLIHPSTEGNSSSYLLRGPPGTGKTSTMHALAAALGVAEIHTLVLGNEPEATGPDLRSRVENVNLIALPLYRALYMYLFLGVRWIDQRYGGFF